MKKETKAWINKAADDLDVARYNFSGGKYEVAAFFCQQCAEKALKAMQIERAGYFDKIHDLFILSSKLELPQELIDVCKRLTAAYIYTRYPDVAKEKDMKTLSENFIKDAERVFKWVKENF